MHTGLQSPACVLPRKHAPDLLSSVCSPDGKTDSSGTELSLKPQGLTVQLCWARPGCHWAFPVDGFSVVGVRRSLFSGIVRTCVEMFGVGEWAVNKVCSLDRKHTADCYGFSIVTLLLKLFKVENSGSYKNMTNMCPKMHCSGGLDHPTVQLIIACLRGSCTFSGAQEEETTNY